MQPMTEARGFQNPAWVTQLSLEFWCPLKCSPKCRSGFRQGEDEAHCAATLHLLLCSWECANALAQNKGMWSLKHAPPLKTSRILQLGILRHPPDASTCEESAGLQIMDLRWDCFSDFEKHAYATGRAARGFQADTVTTDAAGSNTSSHTFTCSLFAVLFPGRLMGAEEGIHLQSKILPFRCLHVSQLLWNTDLVNEGSGVPRVLQLILKKTPTGWWGLSLTGLLDSIS